VTLPRLRLRIFSIAVLLFATCSVFLFGIQLALAQDADRKKTQKSFVPEMDVSLGILGQLTDARTPTTSVVQTPGSDLHDIFTTQTNQGTSPSAGVLGTFHQSFKPWLGYNVNVGYTRFSENYSYGSAFVPEKGSKFPPFDTFSRGSIGTNMYELTIAETFVGPSSKRFNTFGQFGGGGLFFLPTDSASPASYQTRPAMIFGVGANFKLSNRLDLRAEYRGLFYKSPDFNLPPYDGYNFPMTRLFTVTNSPAVSLVYRFGRTAKRPHKDYLVQLR